MSPLELLIAGLTVAIGSCLQGTVGFGLGLLGAPILALIDRDLVPAPLIMASLLLTLGTSYRERGAIDAGVRWALLGRIPGTLLGAYVIATVPERPVAITLGVLVLLAVLVSLSGWAVAPTTRSLFMAGAVSGFTGTATSIGGPPMALVYQRARGATLRGTMSLYFLVGSLLSLAVLAAFGKLGAREIRASLELAPFVAAGFAGSRLAARVLDRGHTRAAVLAASAVSAVLLIGNELLR